jgi:hypothetical protein
MLATTSGETSKLAYAADELAKATLSFVKSTSYSIGKEAVEGLRDFATSSVGEPMMELKNSFETKLDNLAESINNLIEEVALLNYQIALEAKNHKLEWAIANSSINSFKYATGVGADGTKCVVDSTQLAKSVLLAFRRGSGVCISNCGNTLDGSEQEFLKALVLQIQELLGHEPRLARKDAGHFIYYS